MVDWEDGGCHEPGNAEDAVDDDAYADDKKVKVVTATLLQYKFQVIKRW